MLDDSCAPAGLLPATSGLFSVLNPASGHRERILLQPRACTDPELVLLSTVRGAELYLAAAGGRAVRRHW